MKLRTMIGGSDASSPRRLWIVRHGQSTGNIARDQAYAAGELRIDITQRDVDIPLSDLGRRQSGALGRWFATMPSDARPNVVLSSPYLRARETARIIADSGGAVCGDGDWRIDERLREREFGILDRLTGAGIRQLYPDEAKLRASLGKFYHRPPGGESWCDVILRLRSTMNSLGVRHAGDNVLIVCHQVVVLCLRYVLEDLTEAEILAIDREGEVANCSVTKYALDPEADRLRLVRYNFTAQMEREGAPVTAEPDQDTVQA